jgi:hypothetical protein
MSRPQILALVALAACAAPPPPAPAIPIAPASAASAEPAAPRVDPALASVAARPLPAKLVIDGDLAEWGSLLPPDPDPRRDESKPDPNPADAPSRVAVALSGEGAFFAAELGPGAREGVWIGLGVRPPATPPVGEYQRAGLAPFYECGHVPAPDEVIDEPLEDSAACKAVLKRAADKVAAHERRFRRVYRVDRSGVRALDDQGALVLVEGAKVVFREAGRGATLEASLPLRALPRMSAAPVASLELTARSAAVPTSALPPPEGWAFVELPEPVGFEPWAALRAAVFADAEQGNGYHGSTASYHPADPLRLETLGWPGEVERRDYVARDGALYTKRLALADVEVGVVEGSADHLAVLRRGTFHAVLGRRRGTLVDIVPRDREIHAFQFDVETATDTWRTSADWTLWAIGPDGELRGKVMDEPTSSVAWVDPRELHARDWSSFGVRGGWYEYANGKETTKGWERTWRWDEAKRRYVLKERGIPFSPKKKKRG